MELSIERFTAKGHKCVAPAWPLREGDPRTLRDDPPEGLGDLQLSDALVSIERQFGGGEKPVMVGHSIDGLIAQILSNRGLISACVAINSVAPNGMIDLDWGFIKTSAIIAAPLKSNDPILMDAKTFRGAFANTLSE